MKIIRSLQKKIEQVMKQFPVVVITGTRQVGKSTLAKHIATSKKIKPLFFDLELPSDQNKLYDPESIFSDNIKNLIIIDEAQVMPELFSIIRPIVDKHKRNGMFMLLGSVSPFLVKEISQTLAGRVAYIELGGINLTEAEKAGIDYKKLWFKGGFPKPLLTKTNAHWYNWMENYERTFIERDVTMLMNESLSPFTVRKIWQMLSRIHGNLLNYEDLSRSLGISRATVVKYIDFMEGAYLVRRLQPWHINIDKRLVKRPKIYFRDSGLLHFTHGLHSFSDLQNDIVIGASWEGFVIEQIIQHLPTFYRYYFYRTHHGAEIDFVIVKGNKPIASIEIKISNSPDVRSFLDCIDDIKTKYNFVITPESDDYRIQNVQVCSLSTFIKKYLSKLLP